MRVPEPSGAGDEGVLVEGDVLDAEHLRPVFDDDSRVVKAAGGRCRRRPLEETRLAHVYNVAINVNVPVGATMRMKTEPRTHLADEVLINPHVIADADRRAAQIDRIILKRLDQVVMKTDVFPVDVAAIVPIGELAVGDLP